jgi:hypothetical protein
MPLAELVCAEGMPFWHYLEFAICAIGTPSAEFPYFEGLLLETLVDSTVRRYILFKKHFSGQF